MNEEQTKKPLILLVGKSGSGKTTIAEILEKDYYLKSLRSYTTRLPRYEGEDGHTFIDRDTYFKLIDKIATTHFDGNFYCATKEQCDKSDVYVVDPDGVDTFTVNYDGDRVPLIIYINTHWFIRFFRMVRRGNSVSKAMERIRHDKKKFGKFQNREDVIVIKNNFRSASTTAVSICQEYMEMVATLMKTGGIK